MGIPQDFRDLLPPRQAAHEKPDDRPDYLWVYDPQEAKVHILADKSDDPSEIRIHEDMVPEVTHPERYQGYAYAIGGGWRITDEDHHKVTEPYTLKRILLALKGEHPVDLPHIRHHGDPLRPTHEDDHA